VKGGGREAAALRGLFHTGLPGRLWMWLSPGSLLIEPRPQQRAELVRETALVPQASETGGACMSSLVPGCGDMAAGCLPWLLWCKDSVL
jgi:hypothetical protein